VFLTVKGVDGSGQSFTEQTGTLELGFQGCRYFSRHAIPKNSWVTVEIVNEKADSPARRCQARVAWVRKSQSLPGLFQVGVEFEAPGNIWGLAEPPEDWRQPGIPKESDPATLEREIKELLALAEAGTYYQLLRVTSESPRSEVKRCYHDLARKFHPDRHMAHPERMPSLHKIMDAITLAYKTLMDETACKQYEQVLAQSGALALGRQQSEAKKTAEDCLRKAQQCFRAQNYGGSILWLRKGVEIEPDSAKCRALLARSLSVLPAFRREAVEHLQRAIEIDPWNTALHFQLAALYEAMELPWRARPLYEKILEIDVDDSKARERLRLLDTETETQRKTQRSLIDRLFRHSSR
jgi:tetratricopeptide (TPR) repeat protein